MTLTPERTCPAVEVSGGPPDHLSRPPASGLPSRLVLSPGGTISVRVGRPHTTPADWPPDGVSGHRAASVARTSGVLLTVSSAAGSLPLCVRGGPTAVRGDAKYTATD